jgi:hypothetical protein
LGDSEERQSVIVNYQIQKEYCSCCKQQLPSTETSKVKEFEIDKETTMCWNNWNETAEFPEDLDGLVNDFIHDTISFFTVNSYEKIVFKDSEVEKVKEFIMKIIIGDCRRK